MLSVTSQEADATLVLWCSNNCLDQVQRPKKNTTTYESDPAQSPLPPDNITAQEIIAYTS